jgi:hypothetical protein
VNVGRRPVVVLAAVVVQRVKGEWCKVGWEDDVLLVIMRGGRVQISKSSRLDWRRIWHWEEVVGIYLHGRGSLFWDDNV